MKPKVGEVWMIDSGFIFGFCLVLILTVVDFSYCKGALIDIEHGARNFYLEEDKDNRELNGYWNFMEPNDKFIRRVE